MAHQSNHHRSGKIYRYLVCSQNKVGQSQNPLCSKRISYDRFEASLLGLMSDSATLRKALGQPAGEPSELMALRGKLDAADRKLSELMALLEATPSKALAARVQQIETEAERLRGEVQNEEARLKATTPPAVAYDKFAAELAHHLREPGYREQVKTCLRDIIDQVQFIDRGSYLVDFKGGRTVEVWMPTQGEYKWELARRLGPVLVP